MNCKSYIYALLLFVSCFETDLIAANVKMQKYFYKHFTGTIGNMPIKMSISKNDTLLAGSYCYDGKKSFLFISGLIKRSDSIEMEEWSLPNGSADTNVYLGSGYSFVTKSRIDDPEFRFFNGRFKGKFTNENTIEGFWINNQTKKRLPFKIISDTKNQYFDLKFIEHKLTDNITQNIEEFGGFAKYGISAISIFDFKLTNTKVSEKLNKAILQDLRNILNPNDEDLNNFNLCNLRSDSIQGLGIEEMSNEILSQWVKDDQLSGIGCEQRLHSWIISNENDVISIAYYKMFGGGVHESESMFFANYDLRNGDRICASNLFKGNYKKTLTQKAIKILKVINYDDQGSYEMNDEVNIDFIFSITPLGLFFHINDYGIDGLGPTGWNMNRPDFLIPYKDLEDIINTEGLLGRYLVTAK